MEEGKKEYFHKKENHAHTCPFNVEKQKEKGGAMWKTQYSHFESRVKKQGALLSLICSLALVYYKIR